MANQPVIFGDWELLQSAGQKVGGCEFFETTLEYMTILTQNLHINSSNTVLSGRLKLNR